MSLAALLAAFLAAVPIAVADSDELAALARASVERPALARPALAQLHGIADCDGRLLGRGPGYRVEFRASGPAYTPALGARAAHAIECELRLASVERGAQRLLADVPALEPVLEGERARYARPLGIDELYEARADGLEQSFALREPLAGAGDLVVRLELRSELALSSATPAGLVFEQPGIGGIRIGGVTGIDARGARTTGSIEWVAGQIELRLPAAFVERASYPLLLDPLISTVFPIEQNPFLPFTDNPDVAYEPISGRYGVLFTHSLSAFSADLVVQRVSASGALIGAPLTLATGVPVLPAKIAGARTTGRLLAVWSSAGIKCRSIDMGTGVLSPLVSVAASGSEPDVGGEASTADDDVLVVWTAGSSISGAQVSLGAATPSVFGEKTVHAPGLFATSSRAAISRTGGSAGRWLLAVQEFGSLSGTSWIKLELLDRSLNALVPSQSLSEIAAPDEIEPELDGDGALFTVAYRKERGSSGAYDVGLRCLQFAGASLATVGAESILSDPSLPSSDSPSVAMSGSKAFVAWVEQDAQVIPRSLLRVQGIGPAGCTSCEPKTAIGNELIDLMFTPSLAAQYGNWPAQDGLLLAAARSSGTTKYLAGQLLEAFGGGGSTSNLGGGCGLGGSCQLSGLPVLGSPNLTAALLAPDPSASVAVLNDAFAPVPVTCGSCAWNPFQLTFVRAITPVAPTSVVLPVPCDSALLGASFELQWTVVSPASSPCPASPNVSLSNRVRVTLGQ